MTIDNITTDPGLYMLFERIVLEAPPATEYEIDRIGTRQNGSTYRYTERLDGDQKHQIPWGTHDAIMRVTWYPAGKPQHTTRVSDMLPEHTHVEVYADDWDHGIAVLTYVEGFNQHFIIGIEGTVRAMGNSLHLIKVQTETEAVAKVLEIIQNTIDDARQQDYSGDELDDDRSRFDPLDERNYPLHER